MDAEIRALNLAVTSVEKWVLDPWDPDPGEGWLTLCEPLMHAMRRWLMRARVEVPEL